MRKEDIIKKIEERYVQSINMMDEATHNKNILLKESIKLVQEGKYSESEDRRYSAEIEKDRQIINASIANELVEILADIDGMGVDAKNEQLYNKYNLWRIE